VSNINGKFPLAFLAATLHRSSEFGERAGRFELDRSSIHHFCRSIRGPGFRFPPSAATSSRLFVEDPREMDAR